MRYMLLLNDDENAWAAMKEAERNEIFGAYFAYSEALKKSGAYIDGAPLEHSSQGKSVRVSGGKPAVQDGPFTDAKELLGGFYMIEANDLDEALDWAARCPCASNGHVEVRPIWNYEKAMA